VKLAASATTTDGRPSTTESKIMKILTKFALIALLACQSMTDLYAGDHLDTDDTQ
jgi:hypothetical protein